MIYKIRKRGAVRTGRPRKTLFSFFFSFPRGHAFFQRIHLFHHGQEQGIVIVHGAGFIVLFGVGLRRSSCGLLRLRSFAAAILMGYFFSFLNKRFLSGR